MTIQKLSITLIALCFASFSIAQDKLALDKKAIKSMCGCYAVDFDYAETFPTDSSYQIHAPYHAEAGAEWVFVEEESEDRIVIQHLLVVGGGNVIIKHWRQDWLYENAGLYDFDGDLAWTYEKLPAEQVQGQWSQVVYQVDDSPRYAGSATWVHLDGRHWWENTTDAPLPRREYSKRSDYNVMQRTNRHEVFEDHWIHDQDNLKIIRKDGQDHVLVSEKGLNVYTRIDDSKCKAAQKWWQEHKSFWKLVRTEWDLVYGLEEDLYLHKKVDHSLLWETLFELDLELAMKADSDPEGVRSEIRSKIGAFLSESREGHSANY